jgi:hypothetical protein
LPTWTTVTAGHTAHNTNRVIPTEEESRACCDEEHDEIPRACPDLDQRCAVPL